VYLSAEQRLNYLVKVDNKGLLRWARNDELIDTVGELWRDSGNGTGIVPSNDKDMIPSVARRTSFDVKSIDEASTVHTSSSASDGISPNRTKTLTEWMKKTVTPTGIARKLIRRTIRKNTWIYVADKNLNLYIGIKDTGAFQHSSFLAGGQVVSAGLISVHQGLIHKLSPLSGHYRTRIDSFRKFVSLMQDKGVDMRQAEIGRGELALLGVEHINKAKKSKAAMKEKKRELIVSVKDNVLPPNSGEREDTHGDDEDNADGQWRRDILQGRKRAPKVKED